MVRRKPSEIEKNRAQIIADLTSALGNRPNIKVVIDAINGYETSDLVCDKLWFLGFFYKLILA